MEDNWWDIIMAAVTVKPQEREGEGGGWSQRETKEICSIVQCAAGCEALSCLAEVPVGYSRDMALRLRQPYIVCSLLCSPCVLEMNSSTASCISSISPRDH
jgi:hypothetical protein